MYFILVFAIVVVPRESIQNLRKVIESMKPLAYYVDRFSSGRLPSQETVKNVCNLLQQMIAFCKPHSGGIIRQHQRILADLGVSLYLLGYGFEITDYLLDR